MTAFDSTDGEHDSLLLTLTQRFEQQVACAPERAALCSDDNKTGYAELNAQANRLARAIRATCGDAIEPVALLLEHGPLHPLAIMAVLKAGKFYVALDATNPRARLLQVLADSGARLLVTTTRNLSLAQTLCAEASIGLLNMEEFGGGNAENLNIAVPVDTPVCLAYTSGSTGQPKGVSRTHRTEMRSIRLRTQKLGFCADDRFIYHTNYSFAMSFTELFGALLNGAALYPYDMRANGSAELGAWLARNEITVCNLVPALFRRLLDALDDASVRPHPRLFLLGGEPVFQRDVANFYRLFPTGCRLVNYLGLSELAPVAWYEIDRERDAHETVLPIGYALPDVDVQLLDEMGAPVAAGEIGELTLRSEFLTPGYWRRPDLNTAAFRMDSGGSGQRIFHTGDLGRQRTDGCLEYLGRKDFQAKIRGQTVQPAEVEAALFALADIADAVVVAHTDSASVRTRLVAYLVPKGKMAPPLSLLRAELRARLPDYMVPSAFMFVPGLARSLAGKVDRSALPPPVFGRAQLPSPFVAPRNATEQALARLWEELLAFAPIGIDDNYFDLGGDSLLAGQLCVEIGRRFHKRVLPSILADAPTVAQLAACIADEHTAAPHSLVVVQPGDGRTPLFFVPGGDGSILPYTRLIGYLDAAQPVNVLEARGLDGMATPHSDVRLMAADYLAEARAAQPNGPYLLAGACIGGSIAFEMAQQLRAAGEQVGLLLLLDTPRVLAPDGRSLGMRVSKRLHDIRPIAYPLARVRHHLRAVRGLSGAGRVAYLSAKALRLGALAREQATAHQPVLRIHETYQAAVRRYRPEPYAGRIVLLANESWAQTDPYLGWKGLAVDGLDVQRLTGDHNSHLVTYAQNTARQIQRCLDAAQTTMTAEVKR